MLRPSVVVLHGAAFLPLVAGRVQGQFGTTGLKHDASLNALADSLQEHKKVMEEKHRQRMLDIEGESCPEHEFRAPKLLENLPAHHFHVDGCGPKTKPVHEPYGLWVCCNRHDVCYSSCGTTHEFCEAEYEQCMKELCDGGHLSSSPRGALTKDRCGRTAAGFKAMSATMGKKFHNTTQNMGCECFPSQDAALERYRVFLRDVYKKLPEAKRKGKTEDEYVSALLEEHSSHQGIAVFRSVIDAGSAIVLSTGKVAVDFNLDTILDFSGKKPEIVRDEI
eukprot:TRINITY_DN37485_c0_g1_i1.p1 TRINITY_DN37485_c0_g1~~TRINITY_DN37485_c0_g1_i1.p1  ORF type:complete len:278 (-),score=66.38 TRINITY_DN37485_c0_g1_i1:221-1054(-)